jgi:glucosamine--fructose-6-phosphate aminotransferase (isomerizing)
MDDALVVAVSQSGQSPDIVSVLESGRRQGAITVAITNDVNSPLAQTAEFNIDMRAGREYSVAASKSYTASLMGLAMLSAALNGSEAQFEALARVPGFVAEVIDGEAVQILRRAERYRYADACVVLSRGYNYATAFEIALKLKEMTYILAEPYSSADFRHGPVALVEAGFPVVAVVPDGVVTAEMVELVSEMRERGAELIVASANSDALGMAQTPLVLPAGIPEWVSPIVAVVPGQLFALGVALAKGFNPDQPRGLRKVTLTQ